LTRVCRCFRAAADIDTTVKPLFGKQGGAEVSYNPHKPGRPSHALHGVVAPIGLESATLGKIAERLPLHAEQVQRPAPPPHSKDEVSG
jgi:hypothetical protein